MDLITGSILVGSSYAAFESILLLKKRLSFTQKHFEKLMDKLKLKDFKILKKVDKPYGFTIYVKIPPGESWETLEDAKSEIENHYRGKCTIQNIEFTDYCAIDMVKKKIDDIDYKKIDLPPTQLLLGFDYKGEPIIADMKITPHMGVIGNSNSGKSKCVEMALFNIRFQADFIFMNCMDKDFKSINARRIKEIKKIEECLKQLLDGTVRKRPLYILIDEYNVLSRTKGIDALIQDLLSQARHFNIFVICLMQTGNKTDCSFKNLFNCRLAFRTIEDSSLKAFLGCSTDIENLVQRDFYLYHSELQRGRTYTLPDFMQTE